MPQLIDQWGNPIQAHTYSRQLQETLQDWQPPTLSVDMEHLPERQLRNSRARDIKRSHGYAAGAEQTYVDNIVGHQFRLSAKPNYKVLGIDHKVANEWAKDVEARFTDWAEDPDAWIDAEEKRTLTMLARESVRHHAHQGEVLASVEWRKLARNNAQTAIKLIDSERLCNPYELPDSYRLRAGVELGPRGQALAYHIRSAHQSEAGLTHQAYQWKKIAKRKRWGRLQILHIFEPEQADQTRGVNVFVSSLKGLKMLEQFQDATLQNAIVNAMYAAVIESEMDSQTVLAALGGVDDGHNNAFTNYLAQVAGYHQKAKNIRFNGVKIPHLLPNEKLELKTASTNAAFSQFEDTLLRHLAASMNLSFEQLSKDYSKTNYSSARASMLESWKYFLGIREIIPARFCSQLYALWLEEMVNKGIIQLPNGSPNFYQAKSAWCRCLWIAQGQTHIDGLKEVKRIELLMKLGLLTYEKAAMMLGEDYQELFEQRLREKAEHKGLI
ncbi:phage portal protein [Spartinivicinus marinus]|nr:phage portal protein [Spartinivicinus marinus]MCX4025177.1 phage portal protein [Spartinivicinus marinus]